MKTQFKFFTAISLLAFVACNNPSTNSPIPNADSAGSNGEAMTKTTTTTTTTKVTLHPISNFEHRTFYNVKTHQIVKLRIDTVNHYYMDVNSNSKPDYFYYDPIAHDTFDYEGRLVNHALILNNGDYSLDESMLSNYDASNNTSNSTTSIDTTSSVNTNSSSAQGNTKIKQKDDMYKEKTDNSKIKITDNKMKVKTK